LAPTPKSTRAENLYYLAGGLAGFGFGLIVASGFVPHENSTGFWMRFIGMPILLTGTYLSLYISRRKRQDISKDQQHES
jgi:hypothetical protein